MQLDDSGYEPKAEAVADGVTCGLGAIDPPKDLITFRRRNAGPRILDGQDADRASPRHLKAYQTARRCELDSVVNEVGHGFEQEVAVAGEERKRRDCQEFRVGAAG